MSYFFPECSKLKAKNEQETPLFLTTGKKKKKKKVAYGNERKFDGKIGFNSKFPGSPRIFSERGCKVFKDLSCYESEEGKNRILKLLDLQSSLIGVQKAAG